MTPLIALMAFVAAGGVLIATPGPDTALVLRTAAVEGARRGAYTSAGICTGLLVWGLAAALGISAVLAASHTAYAALRAAGAAWLVWLGLTVFVRRPRMPADPGAAAVSPRAAGPTGGGDDHDRVWFWRGLLSNVTNPKVGVFFISFLPQFVPAGVAVAPWIALLVAVHVGLSVLWLGLLIVATRSVGRLLRRPAVARALDRVTGAVLIGAGLRLAAEEGR
ncbi:MAG TPA: LysE family translocator [bacterium]|nr:LysE family translocator [bacterium]